jgi:hypothetical protein
MVRVDLNALRAQLDHLGVDPSWCSLDGRTPEGGFGIKRGSDHWSVYYGEHGAQSDVETFSTEDAACSRLLSRMIDFAQAQRRGSVGGD